MDIKVVSDILLRHIEDYDRAVAGIRHCLAAYDGICSNLIECIAESNNVEDSNKYFDKLFEIQEDFGRLLFARNIDIGARLKILTKEFDRLDDAYIREYWFKRFHAGDRWPT